MNQTLAGLVLAALAFGLPAQAAEPAAPGHYLFAWAGDVEHRGKDFLAVIDADPASPTYGQVAASVATDLPSQQVHHTEYVMPADGMLFANDHKAGRTFVFDLKDPLKPKVAASFEDLAGYAHPHSFLRLPNGHVLASFQMTAEGHHMTGMGPAAPDHGSHGGLVEIDDQGHVIRSASTADPAHPDAMLAAYSLAVLPEIDRVLVTNSGMRELDVNGHSVQVFRLSDLKLLKTLYLDTGGTRYGEVNPEEPRRGPDGSIYVQTLACGIERISGIASPAPKSALVHVFPGSMCGVPTIVGHYLIQSVPSIHSLIALDLKDPAKPVEVSRRPRRGLLAALDGLGREDRAAGGDRLRRQPALYGQARPQDRRAQPRHRLPRRGGQARFQLRRPRLAARLEGHGQPARGGVLAVGGGLA